MLVLHEAELCVLSKTIVFQFPAVKGEAYAEVLYKTAKLQRPGKCWLQRTSGSTDCNLKKTPSRLKDLSFGGRGSLIATCSLG